jgi:hypothetical protein
MIPIVSAAAAAARHAHAGGNDSTGADGTMAETERAAAWWPAVLLAAVVTMSLGVWGGPPLRAPSLAVGVVLLTLGALMRSRRRRVTRRGPQTTATPVEGSEMLQIMPQGDDAFRLVERGGRVVGWLRGATIRIGAFGSEREAVEAAVHGDRVLDAYLRGGARRTATPDPSRGDDAPWDVTPSHPGEAVTPPGVPPGLRMVHDGAYEWVVVGRRPVARLIRPSTAWSVGGEPGTPPAGDTRSRVPGPAGPERTFALEFVVPTSVASTTRLTLARILHLAITQRASAAATVA